MKDAEDILQQKELDYLRGFLDCAALLCNEAQAIPHPIPAPKLFDTLHSRIEDAYSTAAERYDEEVKSARALGVYDKSARKDYAKKVNEKADEINKKEGANGE